MLVKLTNVTWELDDDDMAEEMAMNFYNFKSESSLEFAKATEYFESDDAKEEYKKQFEELRNILEEDLPKELEIDIDIDEDDLDDEDYVMDEIINTVYDEYGYFPEDFEYEIIEEEEE